MAAEWSFTQDSQNASGNHKEYTELYERTREATREAQRQGDAQLKAAMAAATAVPVNTIRICPLSLTFNDTVLEKAYWQKPSMSAEKTDVCLIVFQFLLRMALLCLLFQMRDSQTSVVGKKDSGFMHSMHTLTRFVLCLWIAALCATMLIMQSRCPSWYQGSRGIILLLAILFLWFGEVVAVSESSHPALDLAHIVSQCIFSSMMHRVPFCLHYKMRLFGCGLQTFGTLAMATRVHVAVPSIAFFSLSHFLGVALAYISDQQARLGFLKSTSRFETDKMAKDSQTCSQLAPKRALGGFAGGFAGVSSLKCTYPPSIWTVLSSSYAEVSREDDVSEVSCSSSSTVENNIRSLSSRQQYFPCLSTSNKETARSSDSVCSASSGLQCNVYWQFRAATRGGCDG